MSESPIMRALLSGDFASQGSGTDELVKPVSRQFNLKPGDYAVAMTSDSIVDKELAIMQLVEAEDYKGVYPDFEERLMKSYVLGNWKGAMDPQTTLGWFARCRLLPISPEQYEELDKGIEAGEVLNKFPEWFLEEFQKLQDELAKEQPDSIYVAATCGKCGSRDCEVHWTCEIEGRSKALMRVDEGQERYSPAEEHGTITWGAHIHCNDCHAVGDLDRDEFEKPEALRYLGFRHDH